MSTSATTARSYLLRFETYNELHYASFSHLIRSTFDEALANFGAGSIDLLHIDGRHFYDDVRHDFESWQPKLSSLAQSFSFTTRMSTWRVLASLNSGAKSGATIRTSSFSTAMASACLVMEAPCRKSLTRFSRLPLIPDMETRCGRLTLDSEAA